MPIIAFLFVFRRRGAVSLCASRACWALTFQAGVVTAKAAPPKNKKKWERFTCYLYKDATPYRSLGIIHRKQGEPSSVLSSRLPVNNSGGAMFNFYTFYRLTNLAAGFAARPGRRMGHPKRSTFSRRASPPDGGLCPMTNTQNFSPASGSDEFYKAFAGGGQVGISH